MRHDFAWNFQPSWYSVSYILIQYTRYTHLYCPIFFAEYKKLQFVMENYLFVPDHVFVQVQIGIESGILTFQSHIFIFQRRHLLKSSKSGKSGSPIQWKIEEKLQTQPSRNTKKFNSRGNNTDSISVIKIKKLL